VKESSASVFEFMVRQASVQGKFKVRDSGVTCGAGSVLHAVDHLGRASILVPLSKLTPSQLDWSSKSLSLQFRELDVEGRLTPFLLLQCVDRKLQDQFSLLVDDILDAVEIAPERGLQAALATIDRWRQLFEHEQELLLGPARLAGIMAELLVLEKLTEFHGPTALHSWQGPAGNRHDYVFQRLSLEVKATTNHNNMIVTIHGGKQLLAPDGGELYLIAYQLERTPTGVSVPEKVRGLIQLGIPRLELLARLADEGYRDVDAESYASHRFQSLATKMYRVDDVFPRITPETVQPPEILDRVMGISYALDLGQLAETPLDLASILTGAGEPRC
jgi:hypothetical protein